jgi:hypothetical protein
MATRLPPISSFGDGPWVIAIDLERMKTADRVFDVGRVAAEIKHFFMQYTGNKWLAEPYIGHFLREYACHFPDRDSAFQRSRQWGWMVISIRQ